MMEYKCPARESSKFLCDRIAEYQIEGTVWCNIHARRVLEGDDLTVKVREFASRLPNPYEAAGEELRCLYA